MPERGQWRLTDPQRFIVVIMVVAALFLAAMALGMGSLILVLVAVSMLVVAGLGVFLLGLFYNGRGGVQGTADVHAVSAPPLGNIRGRCDLRLLVRLDGRSAMMMKHRDAAVPVNKWPEIGMSLPVEVPADKPGQLRILWDRVPDVGSRAGGGPTPAGEQATPVYSGYDDVLRPTGLEYDYVISDSPTPPHPTPPYPTRTAPRPATPTDRTVDDLSVGDPAPRDPGPRDPGPRDLADLDLDDFDLDGLDLESLDRLDLSELDLSDLNLSDLDLAELDLSDLDVADAPGESDDLDPDRDRRDPDVAIRSDDPLAGPTVEVESVRGRPGDTRPPDARPPGGPPLPTRGPERGQRGPERGSEAGPERPAPVLPQPRTERVPPPASTPPTPAAPVDAEVVEDADGTGGPDPTGMDVMLIVSNLKASLGFYEGLLRLPVVDASEGTAVLSSGGGRIILQQMTQMSPVERRVMHLQLRVRDVEAVYQELRLRGVTFAHRPRVIWPTDRDEVTVATCRDPDGHAVSLTEWRVRSTGPQSPSD